MGFFDFLKPKRNEPRTPHQPRPGLINAGVRSGVLLSCGGGDWVFCVFPMWDVSKPFKAPDLPSGDRIKYVISFNSIGDGVLPLSALMLASSESLFQRPVYVMDQAKPAEHYPTGKPTESPPYATTRLPAEVTLGSMHITRGADDVLDVAWPAEKVTLRIGQNVGLQRVVQEPQRSVFVGWLRAPEQEDAQAVSSEEMGRWLSRSPPPQLILLLDAVGAGTHSYGRVLPRIGLNMTVVGDEQPPS